MNQPRMVGEGTAQSPSIGSKVVLAGVRRRWTTEGEVIAQLRNGWVVVDFPAWCWVGEPAKLEVVDASHVNR
jgi:hypothetical protein